MIIRPEVFTRVFNTPLMIEPGKAATIAAGLGPRLVSGHIEIDGGSIIVENAGKLGDPLGARVEAIGREPFQRVGNGSVALIPIEGTLVHKGKFVGSVSGNTSYEGITTAVNAAARDKSVKSVVFEIDSYGGEVAGAFDTAEAIHSLSRAKPTLAVLTDFAYSAGYLMASAARNIVLPESGGAGSIGVITMHVDYSAALEKQGVSVTVLKSGAHKADGNPYEALPDEVANRITAELDAARDQFAEAVGKYRGNRMSKAGALGTEAQVYRGQAAVNAGLADQVVRPSQAFAYFLSLTQ